AARGGARQLEVQIALFGRTTEVTIPASAFHNEDGGTAIGLTAGDVFEFRESTGCGSTTIRFVALESARAELTLRADWMGSDALELRARGRLGFAEHGQVGWLRVEELTGRLGERGEPLRVTAFAERDPTLEFVLVPPTPNWAAAGSGMDVTPSARFNLEWELVLWEQPMARCFPDEDALEDELVARIEARRGAEGDDLYDARDEAKATVEATKTLCERAFEHLRLVRFARARPSPGPSDEPWPGYYKYKHKHEAAEDREDGEDEVDDERDAE
ncbi:MAG: hypothetical protein KC468_34640, partial [Myxococcales bacterium]|nr:hypothetical protein [Myxococcales bacterium]